MTAKDTLNRPIPFLRVALIDSFGGERTRITDQSGVARFVGLDVGAEYQAAYKGQYSFQPFPQLVMFADRTNSLPVRVLESNQMEPETLVLTRLLNAPPTPLAISGRVLDQRDVPIANARLTIRA